MSEHSIRIELDYFRAVKSGDKNFEIRDNDRGYQKGDTVILHELNDIGIKTGRSVKRIITYVTGYRQQDNYVVFGMKETTDE